MRKKEKRRSVEDITELTQFLFPLLADYKPNTILKKLGLVGDKDNRLFHTRQNSDDGRCTPNISRRFERICNSPAARFTGSEDPSLPKYRNGVENIEGNFEDNVDEAFEKIREEITKLDPILLHWINIVAQRTDWKFKRVFLDAELLNYLPSEMRNVERCYPDKRKVIEKEEEKREFEPKKFGLDEITRIFKGESEAVSVFDKFEHRPQQVSMAEQVYETFENAKFLICEAGTGVGKSLAYLIPSIVKSLQDGQKVFVSTNTKNLQDQLYFNDIPLAKKILGCNLKVALVKGRSNYVCLRRWKKLLTGYEQLSVEERLAVLKVLPWIWTTSSGDISENVNILGEHFIFSGFRSEMGYCLGKKCKDVGSCYVFKIRKHAGESDVIIGNHALLFSDITMEEGSVLPPVNRIIIDEAHNLERVAAEHIGYELSDFDVGFTLGRLYRKHEARKEYGILPEVYLRTIVAKTGIPEENKRTISDSIEKLRGLTVECGEKAEEFFGYFKMQYITRQSGRAEANSIRFRSAEDKIVRTCAEEKCTFMEVLAKTEAGIRTLDEELQEVRRYDKETIDNFSVEIKGTLDKVAYFRRALEFIMSVTESNFVYWVEFSKSADKVYSRLKAVPVDIGGPMNELLYSKMESMVFTSASLAVDRSFDFLKGRLGLDRLEEDRLTGLLLDSPFDYENNVKVLVPSYLPEPNEEGYGDSICNIVGDICHATKGRTLVLFTSYRMLNNVYRALKDELTSQGVVLLGQGIDGERSSITQKFRNESNTVIFGTQSFWEGVDFPGEILQYLVIVRLPFPVPDEPLTEAYCEYIEDNGGKPFAEYSLPVTALRFKQGFGRLMRTKSDRGIVVIADNRIIKKFYGKYIINSLPTQKIEVVGDEQSLLKMFKRECVKL